MNRFCLWLLCTRMGTANLEQSSPQKGFSDFGQVSMRSICSLETIEQTTLGDTKSTVGISSLYQRARFGG